MHGLTFDGMGRATLERRFTVANRSSPMAARYTLIVGTKEWSSWSLRPYLAMRATGAAFEEVVIQLRRTESPTSREQISKYSAAGKVPVLKIEENGRNATVWDSLAICETLAERHPEAKLWPADDLVRAMARSYAAEMHSGFPDVRDQLSMYFSQRLPTPELRDATKDQIARIIAAWEAALEQHGANGGFLFGSFSVADCLYAPVASRFVTYGIALPKTVQAYVDRLMALPAMRDWSIAARKEVEAGLSPI
jgi:glutathione S-transferase